MMKSKIAAAIFNSGLLVVVIVLLSAPLLMGQLLGTYESGALGAATSGTVSSVEQSPEIVGDFAVYPNVSDFTEYAAFAEEPMTDDGIYQTAVTFTAFSGQQAAYNSLFTIYNTSNSELKLKVESGELSGELPDSKVWLSLVPDGHIGSTLVTQTANEGESVLKLAQMNNDGHEIIVVGGDVFEGQKSSESTFALDNPLDRQVNVGEKVYMGPIFYNGSTTPSLSSTHEVTLQPQQKATLNLVVATTASGGATLQSVLPISISTVR